MNPNTGELIALQKGENATGRHVDTMVTIALVASGKLLEELTTK